MHVSPLFSCKSSVTVFDFRNFSLPFWVNRLQMWSTKRSLLKRFSILRKYCSPSEEVSKKCQKETEGVNEAKTESETSEPKSTSLSLPTGLLTILRKHGRSPTVMLTFAFTLTARIAMKPVNTCIRWFRCVWFRDRSNHASTHLDLWRYRCHHEHF